MMTGREKADTDLSPDPKQSDAAEAMEQQSDVELVARALDDDIDAFEVIYHRYASSVHRTIQAIVRDSNTAEDLLQECFVRAFRYLDRIDQSVPSIAPWLHRIGMNLAYSRVTKRRPLLPGLEMMAQVLISPLVPPDLLAERKELQQAVWEAVEQLNDKHRVIIILYYLQELSVMEIAERLDLPLGTVKSRLFYARKLLRVSLETDRRVAQVVEYAAS